MQDYITKFGNVWVNAQMEDIVAIFDEYMLSGIKMGYGINFNYYADIISPLKSMIYLLIASNVCLMISGSSFKKSDKKSS